MKKRSKFAALLALVALFALLGGCGPKIWNAGDLAQWVREQAVAQGCADDSIELDEWYTPEGERNVWHGRCVGPDGRRMEFGIAVDGVWKASADGG